MATTILLRNLSSRIIRSQLTEGSPQEGYRNISRSNGQSNSQGGGLWNFSKKIFGKSINIIGWIGGKIFGGLAFSFTGLISAVVQTTTFIYNFDWNISDQAIDQRFESLKLIIAGQLGETLGNSFGFLTCGILPSSLFLAFNEPLGLYLLKEVGEEALDELSSNLTALLRLSFRSLTQAFAYGAFKNIRRAIKTETKNPNSSSSKIIKRIFGNKIYQFIETWGEKESNPWSFRLAVEEKIESINNSLLQEFVEEFYDEFKSSCVEAGYIVAQSLDSWILQQNQAELNRQRQNNIIELIPNRENEQETIYLQGNRSEIQTQALNAINSYNLIEARDIGEWVGEPLDQAIRKPHKDIAIKILLRSSPKPPWKDQNGILAKRTQIEIPNVNRSKISWNNIKQAVGGSNGYLWGRFCVVALLDDDNKIKFYADSEGEGEKILERLLKFTNSELSTLNISEEKREGARKKYDKLYKQTTRVYPSHVVIINQLKLLTQDSGRATRRGHKEHRQIKFKLYSDDKPNNFDEAINDLFLPVV